MFCKRCGKELAGSVKFCRFCGGRVIEHTPGSASIFEILKQNIKIPSLVSPLMGKWTKSTTIAITVVFMFAGIVAYAAPIAKDYYVVSKALSSANDEMASGDYVGVVQIFTSIEGRRSTDGQKLKLQDMEDRAKKYLKFDDLLQSAKDKKEISEYSEAREILKGIAVDYPAYESVRTLHDELQSKIEEQLNADKKAAENKVSAESAARAKAQAEANASAKARAQAEAEAQASASAKVRADEAAQASANAKIRADEVAAQTARDAALQQQQLEAQRAAEVRKSFLAQLTAGYKSYRQGVDTYYSSAIAYSNSGQSLLAIAQANSATAVLNSARSSVVDLNSRFTGLPASYYSAADNLVSAIDAYNNALGLLVASEGTTIDYSSSINSYKNTGISYAERVRVFILSPQ